MSKAQLMKGFTVSSGYGVNTSSPYVQVEHITEENSEYVTQMLPSEARDLALNLLMAAEASDSDGFIVEFFRDEMELDMEYVGALLHDFRRWRDEARVGDAP
jgi:hypothetical protein